MRVFSNAEGAYGSNVNLMLDSGRWEDEEELTELYTPQGLCLRPTRQGEQQSDLLNRVLEDVDLAYRLDSVELGVTTVDHYFGTLGGISRAVQRARGERVPVYIADHTSGGTGSGAHIKRTGRAGNPNTTAQSQVVRIDAGSRLRGRSTNRSSHHQHHGLVGDDRRCRPLGLPATFRNICA